ncbi:BTAD domain-containing putative transcriptional regulator [Streptomyces sp. NPDC005017]|uniref:AfsR/SARP family transcriptional regulator n=1 Tax=Streptomyces sp. NPDC005017 TaxID=3364706 RepID=UPI0036A65FBF
MGRPNSSDRPRSRTPGGIAYEVLGPVRVVREGEALPIRAPKQLALLAVLLLQGGELVGRAELVDALWGVDPPHAVDGLVATYAARLRRVLEPDRIRRTAPRLLISSGTAYGLRLERDELDLWRFEDALAEARRARRGRRIPSSRAAYEHALAQWQGGEALAGIPGDYARAERGRLGELRLAAAVEHAEVLLELDEQAEAAEILGELVRDFPHHERLRTLLMLALYRSGRVPEALATFRDARKVLVRDLGLEPGPELTQTHSRMLWSDPTLSRSRPAGAVEVPAELPRDIPDFIGREPELGEVTALLEPRWTPTSPGPCVVVTGAPGVGKTTLAVHAAHLVKERFPDGQLYAELGGGADLPTDPAEVLGRFLEDLGVPARGVPDGLERRAARFRTLSAERSLLVLLDDAFDAEQIRHLMPGSSQSAVLVTSRARLSDLPGRASVLLEELDDLRSRELFRRVAGEAGVDAEPMAAEAVVRACAGHPLALRLLGARVADHGAGELPLLANRLTRRGPRLAELAAGCTSVTAGFRVVYERLRAGADGAADARCFRTLSTLGTAEFGAFAAAAALGTTEDRAARSLSELRELHLLRPGTAPGRHRYHDLLRDFAFGQLGADEAEEASLALLRVVAAYEELVRHADAILRPGRAGAVTESAAPPNALGLLREERTTLVAVVCRAARLGVLRAERLAELTTTIRSFLHRSGHWDDWEALARATLRVVEQEGGEKERPRAAALARLELGTLASTRSSLVEGERQLRLAVGLFRAAGDSLGASRALNNLAIDGIAQGKFEESAAWLEEALSTQRAAEDTLSIGITLDNLALLNLRQGALREARAFANQSIALCRRTGSPLLASVPLNILGLVLSAEGDLSGAVARQRESARLAREQGNLYREAWACFDLSVALREFGDLKEATDTGLEALRLRSEMGDTEGQRSALESLAVTHDQAGLREAAAECRRRAAELTD